MKSMQEENTVKKENASAQSSAEGSAESSGSASASAEREKTSSEPKLVAAPKVVSEFKEKVTSKTTENEPAIPPEHTLSETMLGEALAPCSETEWLTSDTALPTELLTVQKDKRRVSVFAPPVVDVLGETKEIKETKTFIQQDFEGKIGLVAELVASFARLLGNDETAKEGVEVVVSVRFPRTSGGNK
ncbi:unnamed protein product [Cylicocyclus nassatus]|uniref:Uncharacterized protein n=1 Tax=Cylicocyclus nassatus TaxID=53992 RepID=A0AA36GUT3_CYLNA|nr:unnamed protein product [Cylicocyclus nassatus]